MNELELKYGCNPNQKPSRILYGGWSRSANQGIERQTGIYQLPGCISTAGSLVSELKEATGLPAATSFKHVSPAGAAVGLPFDRDTGKDLLGR